MAVDNPKGGMCTESFHPVKTLAKAREWHEDCDESQMPIKIYQQNAGTRLRVRVYDNNGTVISSRG